jgi:hypothetical protein
MSQGLGSAGVEALIMLTIGVSVPVPSQWVEFLSGLNSLASGC